MFRLSFAKSHVEEDVSGIKDMGSFAMANARAEGPSRRCAGHFLHQQLQPNSGGQQIEVDNARLAISTVVKVQCMNEKAMQMFSKERSTYCIEAFLLPEFRDLRQKRGTMSESWSMICRQRYNLHRIGNAGFDTISTIP
jgi:hypothetical protein